MEADLPEVRELTVEEGRALLDRYARNSLGISGSEFMERYDRGDLREAASHGDFILLEMLLPFARAN